MSRIAIVHDWLTTYAGAEKVLEQILKIYPEADLFSICDFIPEEQRDFLNGRKPKTTFIQHLPGAKKRYRNYLPLMPLAIEQIDLSNYDVVISSSHAVAKGVLVGPDQLHICYCHSPIRYAWDMQSQYLSEANLDKGVKSWLVRHLLFKTRNWDSRSSNGVDYFISNSDYIGRRIRKIYRRESTTIYPNVAVKDFTIQEVKDDFYLTASRMVPYKKIDLIVKAFAGMPDKKLIVIGDGPQYDKVKRAATPNITILGYQSFNVLRDHMQRAKAFVFAAEEDFGIIPVEAQACGTPVIAFGKGGALETVVDGSTGVLFHEQTVSSIQEAVHKFETTFEFSPEKIRLHAETFSEERFTTQFKAFVDEKSSEFFQFRKN
ncbi:UNVERIFIED_ORG: glycosyltransferase involved in cell wall biosynthesis [Pseudomonas psychrophila]